MLSRLHIINDISEIENSKVSTYFLAISRYLKESYKMTKMRVLDFFSGCGGMSAGFEKAGFTIAAAFDNWLPAVEVYKKNFKNHPIFPTNLSVPDFVTKACAPFKADMIIGGPPCQDFSHAGNRNEEGGRADLTVSFAKIVTSLQPEWFVMENVPRIRTSHRLQQAMLLFRKAKYGLSYTVLDASLCGVPQKRKRFFMIGHLGGEDGALLPYLEQNLAACPMTVRDYLGDSLGIEHYYRHPRNYNRRGIYSINEPSATIRGVNRPVGPSYPGHALDSIPLNKSVRCLTTLERSYLQTFPKNFIFEGSKTNLELMIGNAVPVNLACYVGNCIQRYICASKAALRHKPNLVESADDVEAERLQGFPDGWTEGVSDTQRYKCLGNAVTTNVITAIGERIIQCLSAKPKS